MTDKRIDTQGRIEAVRFQNQTGSPAAPAAGYTLLYLTTNGLYMETSGGAVIGPFVTGTASAGGRTLISEAVPTGTTVTFSAIPGTYKKLTIEFAARSTQAAGYVAMAIQFNGDTTATNYRSEAVLGYATTTLAGEGADTGNVGGIGGIAAASAPAGAFTIGKLDIIQYANTAFNKQVLGQMGERRDTNSVHEMAFNVALEWENSAAITQIDLPLGAGNYVAGSVFRLYGDI